MPGLVGQAAMLAAFAKIQPGMTEAAVLALSGRHVAANHGRNQRVLHYQGVDVVGMVTLQDGKVIRKLGSAKAVRRVAALPQDEQPADPNANVAGRRTKILGGAFDAEFTDAAPEGAVLIGFHVGLGKFVNNDVVHLIRPIFRGPAGETLGQAHGMAEGQSLTVKAKEGYAVAAITVKAALGVDGFSVTFMRVGAAGLDASDSYESDWIGGMGGGPKTRLSGTGASIIGIIGKSNQQDQCTGLGLLFKK